MSIRDEVYKRAKGVCECNMKTCKHHKNRRCHIKLRGEQQVHHIVAGGPDIISNVKGLCARCHRNTPSYGVGKR